MLGQQLRSHFAVDAAIRLLATRIGTRGNNSGGGSETFLAAAVALLRRGV
jgi:hypothetical protein